MEVGSEKLCGRVVKCAGGLFAVRYYSNGEPMQAICKSRGRVKKEYELIVGDEVEFTLANGEGVIEQSLPRKTKLARPLVSNVSQVIIVVSAVPQPDLVLVDKMLITARKIGLKSVIIVNKSDDSRAVELYNYINRAYSSGACDAILLSSALNGEGIINISTACMGEISVFCGQSAVGKSSIINAISGKQLEIGGLSKKVARGKHTTRHAVLLSVENGTNSGYIVDTPGFSLFTVNDIKHYDLYAYYEDFLHHQSECKFNSCTHTTEPDCAIKRLAEQGSLDMGRYERYKTIFAELKESQKY